MEAPPEILHVIESAGGGGRTRTYDLRIMSCPPTGDSKELQQDSSANSGKDLQYPQLPRNQEPAKNRTDGNRGDDEGYPHEP